MSSAAVAEAEAQDPACQGQPHDEAETEEEAEHGTSTESTDDEAHTGDGTGKKKKKKKKKKKPSAAAGAAGSSTGEQADGSEQHKLTAAEKQEAERRFQKAVDSAKQDEDMWLLLGGAHLHDAKVKKLSEALRNNNSITSVNLSANHIGDEGVQALVDVLQAGGCSELISLDLRGNQLSAEAEALLADLGKQRKQLDISTGPLPPPEADSSSSSTAGNSPRPGKGGRGSRAGGRGAGAGRGHHHQQQQQQQEEDSKEISMQSLQDLVRVSPMFRRYFQTGDDDEGSSGDEEGEQAEQLPAPEELWAQVEQLLPEGESSIPQLSAALVTISKALDSESRALDTESTQLPTRQDVANNDDFQPHFRAVLQHLPQIQQILQLQPPPKIHQSSSATPQPAVGSHRLWACSILHMLLLHNNTMIDKAVAAASLLPTVLALAFRHGHCSAVQCRAVEMLRASFRSSVQELWTGLFTPGYGQQLQQPGSSELLPPLHEALVQIAESAQQQPMGQRACGTGFAIEVANTLLQSSDIASSEHLCPALVQQLEACTAWQSSISPGGAIHGLLKEQDGQLCGPPPPRPAPSIDSMDDDPLDPLNGLMNGQLMALLNCMRESADERL